MILVNFSLIIIIALFFSWVFQKIKSPPLLGMLFTGILLGPYTKNLINELDIHFFDMFFIHDTILGLSNELRTIALIIILIRAGLGINKKVLNTIGISAVKMSFIPCIIEGTFIILISYFVFKLPFAISGVLAFIIAAVSPAVIVPQMLDLKDKGYGKNKEIPTLILAGASIDDVFAITLFSSFLALAMGKEGNAIIKYIINIPVSIITAIIIGIITGYLISVFFKKFYHTIRATKKALVFIVIAIFLHYLEEINLFPFASLLSIMVMGFVLLERDEKTAHELAGKFNKMWVLAEIVLFVMIGAVLDLSVLSDSGLIALLIIAFGLIGRSLGVFLSLIGSKLNVKEKLFCGIAYIPKATVQAAIGGIPLAMGLQYGDFIVSTAVLAIVITAPLGALGINLTHKKLLDTSGEQS